MTMARSKQKKKSWLGNPWVMALLVVGAVWVNFPLLSGIVSFDSSSTAEMVDMDEEVIEVTTRSFDISAVVFTPFVGDEVLPDPFLHESGDEDEWRPEPSGLPGLPTVRMVLCSANSRRALLGDELVGVGDSIGIGKVREIHPQGVVLELATGGRVTVELASISDAEAVVQAATSTEQAPRDAHEAKTLPEMMAERDEILEEARSAMRPGGTKK